MSLYNLELEEALFNFRNNVYQLRTVRGWSQKDLSARVGMNQQNISRHMHKQEPSLSSLACYANALGVSIADLLSELSINEAEYNNDGKEVSKPNFDKDIVKFLESWTR